MQRKRLFLRLLLFICLAALLLTACKPDASTRILFIGNSFTYYNGGLERQLEGLELAVDADSLTGGGYTLADHWNKGDALESIRAGKWDYVVLQEQSQRPVTDPHGFFISVRDFDAEIRSAGAETVLLETWERPDSIAIGVTTAALAAQYNAVGKELGIRVAPAGEAFARALQERPELVLYSADGHPTESGTYLAACVVYATIFEQSPVGIKFADKAIPADIRDFLQGVATKIMGE